MFQTKRGGSLAGKYADGSAIPVPYNIQKMEKGLKIWQAIVSLILLLITVGTWIVNLSTKLESQRIRIEYLEGTQRDINLLIKDKIQSDNQQFDKIHAQLTEILVQLQDKENRK